jgi:hypothetical protein
VCSSTRQEDAGAAQVLADGHGGRENFAAISLGLDFGTYRQIQVFPSSWLSSPFFLRETSPVLKKFHGSWMSTLCPVWFKTYFYNLIIK